MIFKIALAFSVLCLNIFPCEAAWKKTVTKGGKTTVTGDAETMAQIEQDKAAREAFQKEVDAAPRRKAKDPIKVVFLSPYSKKERKEQNLDKIHKGLLDEVKKDPILKVSTVDLPMKKSAMATQRSLNALIARANSKGKSGDVYVLTRLGAEDAVGKNKKTGKMVATKALAFHAEIRSAYKSRVYKEKTRGSIFQNVQIVNGLGAKIKNVINKKIAPKLPSPKAVAQIKKKHRNSSMRAQTGIEKGDSAKTMLKKLFKPRHPKK